MNQYGNPWTEDHDVELRGLWTTKKTREITEIMGITRSWIETKARGIGLPKRGFEPWPTYKVDLLRESVATKTTQELARLLGYSTSSIRKKIQRMGLCKPRHGWSEEQDSILREMWPEHYAIDVATRLGVTRNSVIGRARRIGLQGKRGEGWGNGVIATKERRAANAERRKQRELVKVQSPHSYRPRIPYAALPEIVADPLLLSIMDLKTEHCRWPYGEAGSIQYCGHQALNMQSYCGAHYRMSYQPPRR